MARPSNTAERRAQIVEALIRVMAKNGYDGASVSAVAEEAGLAAGLVHYHFEGKREILLAAVNALSGRLERRWRARGGAAKNPWARLHAYLDAHVALGADADPEAVACWVVIGAEAVRDERVRGAYERVVGEQLRQLEQLVRDVLVEEQRSPRAAPSIAAALLSTIEGAYRLALVARATPSGFAAPMLRQVAEGLIGAAARARGRSR